MKEQVTIFENAQFGQIRTAGTSEQPLFSLADVCKALGLGNSSLAKKRLRGDGVFTRKGVSPTTNQHGKTTMQTVSMTFINEPNLYRCIFQSRKKEAEAFQDWVFEEVLPSIRAKGSYALTQKLEQAQANYDRLHDSWREIYEEHTELREENRRLEYERNSAKDQQDTLRRAAVLKECRIRALTQEVETLKNELSKKISLELKGWQPRKEDGTQGSTVPVATESCHIRQLARTLRTLGVDTGERRLLSWCRANGYLHTNGEARNRPTERALAKGYFEVASSEVIVTPQGQNHILDRILTSF